MVTNLALLVSIIALVRAVIDQRSYARQMEELQQKTVEIERALTRRGTLTNEIAHEIKNPITAILCSAETLDILLDGKIDEEQRDLLRYIREYGDNLLRLVSDFLDVSMAEAGNITARPEPLALTPVAESIVGLLRANANKKHIALECRAEDSDLGGLVDPRHIKQVLFNLVHNAIKFTGEGGNVTVSVRRHEDPHKVRITVVDNGFGIAETDLSTVFDPYARGQSHHPGSDVGAGLGLALCKALIELNTGTIRVESAVNIGTSFIIDLPLARPVRPLSYSADEVSETVLFKPLQGQSILIVDEDLGSRESISALLQAWGGMVDRVSMAVDAVSALGQKRYDAVMIDNADGGAGCELARMIRSNPVSRNATIILATKTPIDEEQLSKSGADKCVEKPLNGKALLSSLLTPRDVDVM